MIDKLDMNGQFNLMQVGYEPLDGVGRECVHQE